MTKITTLDFIRLLTELQNTPSFTDVALWCEENKVDPSDLDGMAETMVKSSLTVVKLVLEKDEATLEELRKRGNDVDDIQPEDIPAFIEAAVEAGVKAAFVFGWECCRNFGHAE